ncbi:sensor domain-containing diguanylate cyclase [Vibrio hannami]|uniref:sensor domain-containing diguanylate cyclase n=1 Tax=Vibrio hannami TaxID=2717094 RepID=UPI0024104B93|nr:sensor domain-containing diguanylate cyclase [Vibrio hannami]MDG3086400.1 sensor domain-containing diguanylate cyclase [Vibrio hannami]
MPEQTIDWKAFADQQSDARIKAEKSLEEMRRFLFEYFYSLGPDPKENISIVVQTLGKVLGSSVALYNRLESGVLKTWCIDHEPDGYRREDTPDGHICYEMTICQRCNSNLTSVVLDDLEGTDWEKLDSNVSEYGLKSYLGFPVLLEGEVVGSLCVVDTEKRQFTDIEKYIIEAFASAIRLEEERLVTQEKLAKANEDLQKKNDEIRALALTDLLTKLPNRRAMMDVLEKNVAILQRSLVNQNNSDEFKGFSIALCDVDHFKMINDNYGHNCGDDVLAVIADILSRSFRPHDHVARWGGEEFLIIFPDTDLDTSADIVERLRKEISKLSFSHKDEHFQVTITFGVSSCTPDNIDLKSCIHDADMALYKGKREGRNCVRKAK